MIVNAVFTLDDVTPTKVVTASTMPQEVHLHNMTKSSNNYIHIGGAGVTLLNSIHLDPGESKMIQLMPNDDLWAVSDPDGLVLGVLTIRQD
jgi:hypothetical protein